MNFSMLNQARELKSKLDKAQKELSDTIVEAIFFHLYYTLF